jgi:hydroxymethylbilane synthase
MRTVVIGARGSSLSRCQAEIVRVKLEARCRDHRFVIKTIAARADRRPDVPMVAFSGEGIFVKELEAALVGGQIDCAVHSLKDLPLETPGELTITAITEREEARDAFISRSGQGFGEMPPAARIGTSSLRRVSQLRRRRTDVEFTDIRGNVDTRLRKLQDGRYDAIVLAACGLIRLGLEDRITELLSLEVMLPEPGQGALAVEARRSDGELIEMLRSVDHAPSRACVEAERSFLRALGGGCRVPIAAYASCTQEGTMTLEGTVVSADGRQALRDRLSGPMMDPMTLGEHLASRLIERGAVDLLGNAIGRALTERKGRSAA